jgi:hypothetical protein
MNGRLLRLLMACTARAVKSLPVPRFTGDQHSEVIFGHHPDGFINMLHGLAFADQFLKHVRCAAFVVQSQVLLEQAAALKGLFQPHHQRIVIERLGDEVIGTALHGLHGHLDMTVCGHHDYRDFFSAVGLDLLPAGRGR